MPANLAASVRQRLLNGARERGEEFQLTLTRYVIERLLYRLSQSSHRDDFILKGAALYAVWSKERENVVYRPTRDVDFWSAGDPSVEKMVAAFREVVAAPVEPDGLAFHAEAVRGGVMREDKRYEGCRLHLIAALGAARIPVQIDIGFGDAVTPAALEGRLAVFIASRNGQNLPPLFTRYTKWCAEQRGTLFERISYTAQSEVKTDTLPKLSSDAHASVLRKLLALKKVPFSATGKYAMHYHNVPVSWVRAHTFVPYFRSERDGEKVANSLKSLHFESADKAGAAAAVLCSSTFFVWWITISDCYHLLKKEIDAFPFPIQDSKTVAELALLAKQLDEDLRRHSKRRTYVYETTGKAVYDEFYPKRSKPIIDEIDRVLAAHYGFSDEELDFILNYDIKYRMGRAADEGEE